MVQVLCDGTRRERTAQEVGVGCSRRLEMECRTCQWTTGFLGDRESRRARVSCSGHPRTETQYDVGNAGSERREQSSFGSQREQRGSFDQLGHNRVTLRCDNEPANEALAREIGQEGNQTESRGFTRWEKVQSNGIIERAVGLVAGQARTLKAALEHRIGTRVPPDARILCWLVEYAAYLINRCDIGSDGKTPLQTLHGRRDNTHISEIRREDPLHAGQASEREKVGTAIPSRSVCGDAELVIRSSGRHRARNGDQDTLSEHQENPRVREMGR